MSRDEILPADASETRETAEPGDTTGVTGALSTTGARPVTLAVGPEGGWTDYEADLLRTTGRATRGFELRTDQQPVLARCDRHLGRRGTPCELELLGDPVGLD